MIKYDFGIEGAYGEYNFGDDALLVVLYNEIKRQYPKKSVAIIIKDTGNIVEAKKLIPDADVYKISQSSQLCIKHYIYGGGTQFFSFKKSTSLMYRVKLVLSNPKILKRLFLRSKYATKANEYFLGIGLGPFENSKKLTSLSSSVSPTAHIFVRDKVSLKYAREINFCDARLYTDICFLERDIFKKDVDVNPTIAVIVRDWHHSETNVSPFDLVKLKKQLNDFRLVFYLLGDDPLCKGQLDSLGFEYYQYKESETSYASFWRRVSKSASCIITSRYHGIIYSIISEIPCIALNIEPKLEIASKELGVLGCVDRNNLNRIPALISSIQSESEVKKIKNIKSKNKTIATNMIDALFDVIDEHI